MSKAKGICKKCGKKKEIHTVDSWCNVCYKKHRWKPKLRKCKRCGRSLPHHGKGLCAGCYNSTFHIDKVKIHNARRTHNIEPDLYKKLIEKCLICDFDKIVEIHHLDHDNKNSSKENLVGLCPNHHKMLHMKKHQKTIFNILKEKGYKVPTEGYNTEGFLRIKRKQPKSHLEKNQRKLEF